jgi:hypothetical protein
MFYFWFVCKLKNFIKILRFFRVSMFSDDSFSSLGERKTIMISSNLKSEEWRVNCFNEETVFVWCMDGLFVDDSLYSSRIWTISTERLPYLVSFLIRGRSSFTFWPGESIIFERNSHSASLRCFKTISDK